MVVIIVVAAALAACTDAVSPVRPNAPGLSALRDGFKRGQCFLQVGFEGTQVDPNADGLSCSASRRTDMKN